MSARYEEFILNGLEKTIYSSQSKILCSKIKELRHRAGMSQRELAAHLKIDPAVMARIELGERRVDLIECHSIFTALGVSPKYQIGRIIDLFDELLEGDSDRPST